MWEEMAQGHQTARHMVPREGATSRWRQTLRFSRVRHSSIFYSRSQMMSQQVSKLAGCAGRLSTQDVNCQGNWFKSWMSKCNFKGRCWFLIESFRVGQWPQTKQDQDLSKSSSVYSWNKPKLKPLPLTIKSWPQWIWNNMMRASSVVHSSRSVSTMEPDQVLGTNLNSTTDKVHCQMAHKMRKFFHFNYHH